MACVGLEPFGSRRLPREYALAPAMYSAHAVMYASRLRWEVAVIAGYAIHAKYMRAPICPLVPVQGMVVVSAAGGRSSDHCILVL